ncbi:MAG: hypothetical protein DDT26_00216 [Dehalococcoidia bacterium]|nr:hypothetical protein [Chloroflexota bacterium]
MEAQDLAAQLMGPLQQMMQMLQMAATPQQQMPQQQMPQQQMPGQPPQMDGGMPEPGQPDLQNYQGAEGEDPGQADPYMTQESEGYADGGMDGSGVLPPGDDVSDTLHSRVQNLERHTGLRKSAASFPLYERVGALERHHMGEEFAGSMPERVLQLEHCLGLRKAASQAPDTIAIEDVIAAGIKRGIEAVTQMQKTANDYPSPEQMRIMAPRRSQPRYTVNTAEESAALHKSLGFTDGDLDKPLSFGEALLAQYHLQGGIPLSADMDDDN